MRLWLRYIRILVKSLMQYRTSFILLSIGQFFAPFTLYLGLYLMFKQFGSLGGYTFHEVALCFGIVHMSFAITEMALRGFDTFAGQIRTASFDRLLLRPVNLVLQVLGCQFELSRISRLAQGVVVLTIALSGAEIQWTALKVVVFASMIVSGVLVFSGIFIAVATIAFWTVQGIELANVLTDGGREATQYPLDIYRKGFRLFFTFVVPLGMANYVPLQYVLGKADASPLYALAPLYCLVFIVPCVALWYFGVRHYKSAGS